MRKPSSPSVKVTFTDREQILKALDDLIQQWIKKHHEIDRVILFGSFARGDFFPSSDIDVLIILKESTEPFIDRIVGFLPNSFPIDIDVFPYTEEEVKRLSEDPHSFVQRALSEGNQVYP